MYNEVLMQVLANEVEVTKEKKMLCESLESVGFRKVGENLDALVAITKDEKATILVYRNVTTDVTIPVLHIVNNTSVYHSTFGTTDITLEMKSVQNISSIGYHEHVDIFTFNKDYYAGPIYTNKHSPFIDEYDYPDTVYKLDNVYILV